MLKLVNLDHEMQFLDAETPLPDPWPFVYDYDDDDDCSLACHFTTNNFTNNSQSDIISLWIILSFIIV